MDKLLLGNSIQIKELNETIKQVAPTDISILITGESGTGKELVANAVHFYSKRRNKPLFTVNCGAIPEGIIESELFGHQKGAFTGAIDDRKGYFEMADEGTIFLDEIGDMPLSTQVKILRVLESGQFIRVGGNKTIKVDVRVIAATNRDLERDVLNKNFREDLYFRLKSINLNIPPLRERKSDVKILFKYFIESFCKKNNITFRGIDEEAMDYLSNYVWKGNARELRNFCESLVVLYPDKKLNLNDVKKHLQSDDNSSRQLPAVFKHKQRDEFERDFLFRALLELKSDIVDIKNMVQNNTGAKLHPDNSKDFFIPAEDMETLDYDEIEKRLLQYYLENSNWNIKAVSGKLGQTPRNIYRKMNKYNISRYN